jgi:signal transduction histidine kinase/ActR/RegA family two-component response regulator
MVPWVADEAERVAGQVMETGRPVTDMELAPGTGQPGNGRIWMAGWYPMKDSTGRVTGISVVTEEITRQRKLEEQLRQSQKMEAIGALAGGIAHDFNNMLAAILGFTEMAIEDVRDRPHVDRSLQNVSKAAMRARELVKQILTFSRKTSHKRHPLSLTSVVEETLQLLRASIPATIGITFAATAATDTVVAAPTEIQQVLMNLVTNASFAMREKGGVIEVTLSDIDVEPGPSVLLEDTTPREYLRLLVRDTGIGMSPAVMRRMFEPFFTTREAGAGSGMGLAVVYGIVKDLGGTITVESEPGVGSIFSVLLPKAGTEELTQDTQPGEIPGGTERILFVDDEELLVEWAKTTLEKIGYRVTVVTDGQKALKIFSANPSAFDLVITDQAMPGMGGTQLARELLTITAGIPIILCTGHSDIVSRESAAAMGVGDFLMKPVSKVELAASIRRVLDTINK